MTTLKFRRGTTSQWSTANPVLAPGEPGFDTTTGKVKFGDGTTAWNSLPYFVSQTVVDSLIQQAVLNGAVTFQEDFARCTLGDQPDATDTAYNTTIGDAGDVGGNITLTAENDDLFGGLCAQFTNPTVFTTTFGFLGEPVTAPTNGVLFFERFYWIDVLPLFRTSILLYKDSLIGGTHIGSFALGGTASSYKFVLVNVDTNSTSSSHDVPIAEWFRARIKLDTIAHTQEASLFLGPNVFGANPDEVISGSVGSTVLGYVEDGILTNPNITVKLKVSHVRNMLTPLPPPRNTGLVVLDADADDPALPLPNTLYVRKTT